MGIYIDSMNSLYEHIVEQILIESKIDSFARVITQKVIRAAKNFRHKVTPSSDVNLVAKVSWPQFLKRTDVFASPEGKLARAQKLKTQVDEIPVIRLSLSYKLMQVISDDSVKVSGSWNPMSDTLKLNFTIKSSTGTFDKQHLSMLQKRAYGVIRHELEHTTQDTPKLTAASAAATELKSQAPVPSMMSVYRYFTSEAEIEAFVMGLYHIAKRTRTPFKDVVRQFIQEKISFAIRAGRNPVEVRNLYQDVEAAWLSYAKKRLPKAVV